jgi:hypothetical protein
MDLPLSINGVYCGLKPSEKNPEYASLLFKLPVLYQGNLLDVNTLSEPNQRSIVSINNPKVAPLINSLVVGSHYRFLFSVYAEQPNGKYPAKVGLRLIKAEEIKKNV